MKKQPRRDWSGCQNAHQPLRQWVLKFHSRCACCLPVNPPSWARCWALSNEMSGRRLECEGSSLRKPKKIVTGDQVFPGSFLFCAGVTIGNPLINLRYETLIFYWRSYITDPFCGTVGQFNVIRRQTFIIIQLSQLRYDIQTSLFL